MEPFSFAVLLEIAPIYLIAIAIVAGDALGVCAIGVSSWVAVVLAIVSAMLFLRRLPAVATAVALIAIAAATSGPAREVIAPPSNASSIRHFADRTRIVADGWIDRTPERFPDREYVFVDTYRAGTSLSTMRPERGTIRVTVVEGRAHVRIGDEVQVRGELRFGRNFGDPGEFDYAAYLARNGIAARMVLYRRTDPPIVVIGYRHEFPQAQVASVRSRIGAFIDANLHGDERAEMRALVIGDRSGISRSLRRRFARAGLAHLLVISGLHLGFVAAAAFALLRLLMSLLFPGLTARGYANKVAATGAALAVVAYAAIAGHHISTTRALVMVLAYTLAVIADRSREVLASLALAAIIICFAMPGSTADIGFQLSFVSVLAIILGMRRFAAWWRKRNELRGDIGNARRWIVRAVAFVSGYVAVSFWALLGVAPLTTYHFNQFSVVGLVANSIVVPVMALGGVVCGLAACAIGLVAPAIGAPLLHIAGWALWLGTWLAGWFVRWPYAYFRTFTPTPLEVAIAYGWVMLWLTRPTPPSFGSAITPAASPSMRAREAKTRASAGWRFACAALLALLTVADAGWWSYQRWFNPDLRVTFLSVGQGDGAVVRFGGGRVMVIDAGGAWPDGFNFGERIVARYLWGRKIMHVDYIVVSHPDLDHFGGMGFIARNFSPSQFWTTGATSPDVAYRALMNEISAKKIPVRIVNAGTPPMVIGGATVRCLSPEPGEVASNNNMSMVLRIAEGHESVMFTGDLEARGERLLIDHTPESELASTVLKAPHHGSRTSSSPPFVEAVRPRVVVLSLGYRNRFHFPAPIVVDRYREQGALVLRTDRNGAVSVDFRRPMISVRTYDQGPMKIAPFAPRTVARNEAARSPHSARP